MCNIVVINRGEIEIGTPKEFLTYFGFPPQKNEHYKGMDVNACLCQCDIEETLIKNKIEFKKDCGDIYVGMLDGVIGDDFFKP